MFQPANDLSSIASRPRVLGVLLVASLSLFASQLRQLRAGEVPRPPNIVVIMADDLGYGDVGFLNPNSKIKTPNIDRLAKEGLTFTDGHTVGGVCTPARYALLTGRYGWRTRLPSGVLDGYAPRLIEEGRLTMAEMLRRQGYTTALIGKWHLGMSFGLKDPLPEGANTTGDPRAEWVDFSKPVTGGPTAVGFDYFFGIPSSIDISPYILIENERVLQAATVPIQGGRGMDAFRAGLAAPDFKHVDFMPLAVRKTREYLEARAQERTRPFFLFLPTSGVHNPIVPAPEFAGKSAAGPYGDFVEQLDDVVGNLLRDLDRLGLTSDTLVVFTSDNGPAPLTTPLEQEFGHDSSGGWSGLKGTLFEGGHRMPFVARWPGHVPAGARTPELVAASDWIATLAALTGFALPREAAEDSFNFLPVLLGQSVSSPVRPSIVFHADSGNLAIREGSLKLTIGEAPQLFDLASDPKEERNLATERWTEVHRLSSLLFKIRVEGRERP